MAAITGVGAAAIALALLAPSESPAREESPLPDAVSPAFAILKPRPLGHGGHTSRWADVLRPTLAYHGPSSSAQAIATLSTQTPEGTTNILLVLDSTTDAKGDVWVAVQLPVLPNNTVGWVPRRALGGYTYLRTHLEIDLGKLTATLERDGREIFRAPIGIGLPRWPTPTGSYYVRDRLTRYRSAFYGPVAFGTSARSAVLTDWPAGGFIGIHGTDRPELLPGRVSHGCIRLKNRDIILLDRLLPVGTPITIVG